MYKNNTISDWLPTSVKVTNQFATTFSRRQNKFPVKPYYILKRLIYKNPDISSWNPRLHHLSLKHALHEFTTSRLFLDIHCTHFYCLIITRALINESTRHKTTADSQSRKNSLARACAQSEREKKSFLALRSHIAAPRIESVRQWHSTRPAFGSSAP